MYYFRAPSLWILAMIVLSQSQLGYSSSFWLSDAQFCAIDKARYGQDGHELMWRESDRQLENGPPTFNDSLIDSWTYTPSCSQRHGDQQLCTFVDTRFSNGRGISIVTTPDIAAEVSVLPILSNKSEVFDVQEFHGDAFAVREVPGRGMGVVATRTIFTGDVVFAHPPVSVYHNEIFKSMTFEERLHVLRESVNGLPPDTMKLWWNLAWQGTRADLAEDIINTNSFRVFLGKDRIHHSMISPEMSRLNHDCRPNLRHRFSHSSFSHIAYATRTIYAGEELTISYIDPLMSHAQRGEVLGLGWGFNCSCSLCSAQDPYQASASDNRIKMIRELRTTFSDWSVNMTGTPEMAEFLVSLYEQERLYGWIGEAYEMAALAWNAAGEEYKARTYAALAVQYKFSSSKRVIKQDSDIEALLQDPTAHWSWRMKV